MRVQMLLCDKCGKPIKSGEGESIRISIGSYIKDADLHKPCLTSLVSMVETATIASKGIPLGDDEDVKNFCTEVKEEKGKVVKPDKDVGAVKPIKSPVPESKMQIRGPMSGREKNRLLEEIKNGKALEIISEETGRSIKTLQKLAETVEKGTLKPVKTAEDIKSVSLAGTNPNTVAPVKKDSNTVEETVIETKMDISIKNKNSATINGKHADLGMLRSLREARWKYDEIALDMRLDVEEVTELDRVYRLWLKNPKASISVVI